jgi:hypothetical protein
LNRCSSLACVQRKKKKNPIEPDYSIFGSTRLQTYSLRIRLRDLSAWCSSSYKISSNIWILWLSLLMDTLEDVGNVCRCVLGIFCLFLSLFDDIKMKTIMRNILWWKSLHLRKWFFYIIQLLIEKLNQM